MKNKTSSNISNHPPPHPPRHTSDTNDGSYSFFRKHVRNRSEYIGRPGLVGRNTNANQQYRNPKTNISQWLRKRYDQGEKGNHQHGFHAAIINGMSSFYKIHREPSTTNTSQHG